MTALNDEMKDLLLNSSHSAMAYVSYLMGYRTVDAAMADPLISEFVSCYTDSDLTDSIPAVEVQELAADGSTKIPNTLLPCIEHKLDSNQSIEYLAFAIAAWFRYLLGIDEESQAIEITDPNRDELMNRLKLDSRSIDNIIRFEPVFGLKLPAETRFVTETQDAYDLINSKGIKVALIELLARKD